MPEWLRLVVDENGTFVNDLKILESHEQDLFKSPVSYNDVVMMYQARLWAESESSVPFLT